MKKRYLCLTMMLLLLICGLSVLLISCNKAGNTPPDSDSTGNGEQSEPPSNEYLLLNNCSLVLPSNCNDELSQAGLEIRTGLVKLNANVIITDDHLKFGEDYDMSTVEIIFGNTGHPQMQEIYSGLAYDTYGYRVIGNKVYVYGHNITDLNNAATGLILAIRSASSGSDQVRIGADAIKEVPNEKRPTNSLPVYEGGKTNGCYDVGDNVWLINKTDTTETEYRTYLQKLQADGYTLHRENRTAEMPSATLCKDARQVDVWYTPNDSTTRITVHTNKALSLIPAKADSDGTHAVSSKLAVVGDTEAAMCLILRLCDGRFVIFDSGNNTDRMVSRILATLKYMALDPEDITVAAWVLTHGHHDHVGGFSSLIPRLPEYITIENILCNFMAAGSCEDTTVPSWGNTLRSAISTHLKNTKVYKVHPGYRFTFGNAVLEVLSTQENYFDQYPTWSEGSLVIRVTVDGTVLMVPADTPENQSKYLTELFGSYLKCDILQAIHHGNFGATSQINRLFDPDLVIYCTTESYFNQNLRNHPYNKTLLESLKAEYIFGEKVTLVNLPFQSTAQSTAVLEEIAPDIFDNPDMMRLTPEELQKVFHGALSIKEESNGYYRPVRLTDSQLARYKKLPAIPYAYATAGIRMEFDLSSESFSFAYTYSKAWGDYTNGTPKIDIFEDGVLTQSVTVVPNMGGYRLSVEYTRKSSNPTSRITVYFPHNAELMVTDVILGQYTPVASADRKFLILGDSISQGLRGNSAAGCYTNLLQRHFNAELLNQSVGGEFFDASALADLSSVYVPTDVIVALGTNDIYGGYTFEQIKANMRAYFAKLKELYGDTRVFVISPPYTADCSNPSKNILPLLQQVSEEIRACCEEYGFYYCNGYDFVPHESKYFTDNAHPNDLGFAEYARSLIAEIEKICGKEKD